ncbi:Riboflavin kinase [Labilithrix luteola]|uniref:Riboflavin biosynthesis protein n=1 Tax=Labilithrix luteola TaxID=1391654 RepID=A0A0K1PX28_9BACT|nr:Riboflavin kinase [Labilithrix luteola]
MSQNAVVPERKPSVVAIGNFDGVHRGHQAVLKQARALADARNLECVVLTFDPHPSVVLGRPAPPRLASLDRRVELLRASGASEVVIQPFTKELASWSPEHFVRDLLEAKLLARVVVVGQNFRFGHKRAGDFETMKALGKELGFDAVAADVAGDAEGPFSSTRVRGAIGAGEVVKAAEVLGRSHALTGVVEQGDKLGRTLGFPTANLGSIEEMLPPHGVYAVWVDRIDDGAPKVAHRPGVMNIGVRPTVDGTKLRVEVHLLDFEGDLYGATLRVELVERLRGEMKFDGLPALQAQIAKDSQQAGAILARSR